MNTPARPTTWRWLSVLLVFLAVVLPRLFELDRFANPDESEWIFQSGNFYYALGQRDLAETFRREHPGVLPMLAGTAAYVVHFPEYRGLGQGYLATAEMQTFIQSYGVSPLELLATARFFLVLAHGIMLTSAYAYARKLFGQPAALVGILLVAFDPFHLGLTRVLHLDGLLANLILLATLAWLSYLYQGRRKADLSVAALGTGLALLTRSPGIFLLPLIGILALLAFWRTRPADRKQWLPIIWKQAVLPGIIFALLAFAIMTIIWPSMWVQPLATLKNVFGGALHYAQIGHLGDNYFYGQIISSEQMGRVFSFYPLTFLWRSTPLTVFGLLALAISAWRAAVPLDDEKKRQMTFDLILAAVLFVAFMNLGSKKIDRYALPAHSLLMLAAGIGWVGLFNLLAAKRPALTRWAQVGALLVVLAQLASALPHFPYYLTYYNPLLGGPRRAPQAMIIGWGEGLDLAANYLNAKPNAAQLNVLSSYSYGGLSFFFEGTTTSLFPIEDQQLSPRKQAILNSLDYVVVYVNGWQRMPPGNPYDGATPEHIITLHGIEYVRIYPSHAIPILQDRQTP